MTMSEKKIVICGGGVIGASVAYHLTLKGAEDVTVVERYEVACASSGKAGGFLSLDLNDKTPTGSLSRLSFEMHKDLAETLKPFGEVDYRPLKAYNVETTPENAAAAGAAGAGLGLRRPGDIPEWLNSRRVAMAQELAHEKQAAQVNPYKLCNAMMDAAKSREPILPAPTLPS